MKKLTFSQRLWVPLVCSLLCMLAISTVSALDMRELRLEERKTSLQNATEMALSIVLEYAKAADAHQIPTELAQKEAARRIQSMRYGKDGYITIIDASARVVMHPQKPELNGKDLSTLQDANGAFPFRESAAVGQRDGGGFTTYVWPRPGSQEPVPKLSRVDSFKPWGWVIVSGAYVDDIEQAFVHSVYRSALILILVSILVSIIVAMINRSLRQSLGGTPEYAAEIAKKIASGDLSGSVNTPPGDSDSLLFAMQLMKENLVNTIRAIRQGADTIATASSEIAAGNMDLSARTEAQASALEQTAASMDELSATVRRNSESAQQANQLALSASAIAVEGGSVVSEVVQTMGVINASAERIVDIIGVINGLAFQTNILALNAAVEAARAGEQGRGFAVVASEVRVLAQRSASAAKEIKAMIDGSVEQVNVGSILVNKAGQTMEQLVKSVKDVTEIMSEITSASIEQSTGIAEVSQAMAQMDQTTQQNAALVEEAAAAASSLQDQAASLTKQVSLFKLVESKSTQKMAKSSLLYLSASASY